MTPFIFSFCCALPVSKNKPYMPTDHNPRFRTAHDAGKYIAALLYPMPNGWGPDEFGAVPKVLPNPAWEYAQFEVIEGKHIVDLHAEEEQEFKTSREWYDEYANKGYIIVMASGWDDIPAGEFDEFFHFTKITRTEFLCRMHNSTLDSYTK